MKTCFNFLYKAWVNVFVYVMFKINWCVKLWELWLCMTLEYDKFLLGLVTYDWDILSYNDIYFFC